MTSTPSSEGLGAEPDRPAGGELARRLGEGARDLQAQTDPRDVLATIVADAVAVVHGAAQGSVSLVEARRHVVSQAASGDLPRAVDALQEETGQGPCLSAVYDEQMVRVDDLATEQRWPEFSRRAAALGASSMLTFQLYVDGDNLGALNLYGAAPHVFDDESEHVGLLLASHAAVAYAGAKRESALARGLVTRQVVGQAQGILMERHRLSAEQAFSVLVRASQERNVKLVRLAEDLVRTGELSGS